MSETTEEPQADPVVKVARDLAEIVELYERLRSQAVRHGDHALMPGGHAMAALGNVANMEAWENQQQATERHEHHVEGYRRAYTSVEDEDPDEAWSAFQLLEFWSEQWRREHGAEYGKRPTIATEANFLHYLLEWAWDHEPAWEDFARDVHQARLRLENILTDGKRAERTRVKCPSNDCPNRRNLLRLVGVDGREDVWKCSGCKRRYNADEFKRAEALQMNPGEEERYLPVKDAIEVLKAQGRQERTVRRWLGPPVRYVDRCKVCRRRWAPQEYAVCPGIRDGEECGGELRRSRIGDPDAVVGGYCDTETRRTWVSWPDIWRRHLREKLKDASA